MSFTSLPESAVCYILADIPGQGEFQGSGVIIGPHTILTASHLLYDADTGASADAVSVYPGFTPGTTAYNPQGALGGLQAIHFNFVSDGNDELSAAGTQDDYAIIDTSTDLSRYGKFALAPNFTSGDVVAKGYPASNGGNLAGTEGIVYQDGRLTDLVSSALDLGPGYSGGPLYEEVEHNGSLVPAVVGTVSTGGDATKLTKDKINTIRRWAAGDRSLYQGGDDVSGHLVPQIGGTVSDSVNAARASSSAATLAARLGSDVGGADIPRGHAVERARTHFADLVNAIQGAPAGGGAGALAAPPANAAPALARPGHHHHHGRHAAAITA